MTKKTKLTCSPKCPVFCCFVFLHLILNVTVDIVLLLPDKSNYGGEVKQTTSTEQILQLPHLVVCVRACLGAYLTLLSN